MSAVRTPARADGLENGRIEPNRVAKRIKHS